MLADDELDEESEDELEWYCPELAELLAPELRELDDDWLEDEDLPDDGAGFALLTEPEAAASEATRGAVFRCTRTGNNPTFRDFLVVLERICILTMT